MWVWNQVSTAASPFWDQSASEIDISRSVKVCKMHLNLLLLQTMLPDHDIRRHTILAVVEQNDPMHKVSIRITHNMFKKSTNIPSGSIDSPIRNS